MSAVWIPALIGSVVSGLGALALSIYTDFLPTLMPVLGTVTAVTYLKIVALLLLVLLLVIALAFSLYMKSRQFRPRALSGMMFGLRWSAELLYKSEREEIEIELQWLCPKHKVFLGLKSAGIPEAAYYNFWCTKCGNIHEMLSVRAPVYVQEAEIIVRREILGRLRW